MLRGGEVERPGLVGLAHEEDGRPVLPDAVRAGVEAAAVAEHPLGDEPVGPALGDERARVGVGLEGGPVPAERRLGVEAVGQDREAGVLAPAPLAALLGLGGAEAGEGQGERDAELGEVAEVPAAGGHLLDEADDQRGGVGVLRRGAELAPGVGAERRLARRAPGAVERAAIVARDRERGLQQPPFRVVERRGVEIGEDRLALAASTARAVGCRAASSRTTQTRNNRDIARPHTRSRG